MVSIYYYSFAAEMYVLCGQHPLSNNVSIPVREVTRNGYGQYSLILKVKVPENTREDQETNALPNENPTED